MKPDDATALLSEGALSSPDWAARIRSGIGTEIHGRVPAVRALCAVLADPRAVAHPDWPALVREVMNLTLSYEALTERAYGERLTLEDMEGDEDGALQWYADEHLYTVDMVLELLGTPDAVRHDAWSELLASICHTKAERIGHMGFGDAEILRLFNQPHVLTHPHRAELIDLGRDAFPFASWSELVKV